MDSATVWQPWHASSRKPVEHCLLSPLHRFTKREADDIFRIDCKRAKRLHRARHDIASQAEQLAGLQSRFADLVESQSTAWSHSFCLGTLSQLLPTLTLRPRPQPTHQPQPQDQHTVPPPPRAGSIQAAFAAAAQANSTRAAAAGPPTLAQRVLGLEAYMHNLLCKLSPDAMQRDAASALVSQLQPCPAVSSRQRDGGSDEGRHCLQPTSGAAADEPASPQLGREQQDADKDKPGTRSLDDCPSGMPDEPAKPSTPERLSVGAKRGLGEGHSPEGALQSKLGDDETLDAEGREGAGYAGTRLGVPEDKGGQTGSSGAEECSTKPREGDMEASGERVGWGGLDAEAQRQQQQQQQGLTAWEQWTSAERVECELGQPRPSHQDRQGLTRRTEEARAQLQALSDSLDPAVVDWTSLAELLQQPVPPPPPTTTSHDPRQAMAVDSWEAALGLAGLSEGALLLLVRELAPITASCAQARTALRCAVLPRLLTLRGAAPRPLVEVLEMAGLVQPRATLEACLQPLLGDPDLRPGQVQLTTRVAGEVLPPAMQRELLLHLCTRGGAKPMDHASVPCSVGPPGTGAAQGSWVGLTGRGQLGRRVHPGACWKEPHVVAARGLLELLTQGRQGDSYAQDRGVRQGAEREQRSGLPTGLDLEAAEVLAAAVAGACASGSSNPLTRSVQLCQLMLAVLDGMEVALAAGGVDEGYARCVQAISSAVSSCSCFLVKTVLAKAKTLLGMLPGS